jgi:hypothetical protein
MQTRASPFCVQHLLSAAQSLLFVLTVMYDHTHRVRLRLERHTAAAANSVPDAAAILAFLWQGVAVCRASLSREYMHDRFWTGRIAEHVAVGQNLCYTWSIIGKEGDL